ncbi:MAG: DegV family protein [Eubacteriales bacterium]
MSKPYIIFTDDGSDTPFSVLSEYECGIAAMHCTIEEASYNYVYNDIDNYIDFYDKIRNGFAAHTEPLSKDEFFALLAPYMEKGLDILFISFSSLLSGSYHNLCEAKEMLKKKYPTQSLIIVDSKRAAASVALMVEQALKMQQDGKSLAEVYQWLERYKLSYHSLFMIDDIFYITNESERGTVKDQSASSAVSSTLAHFAMLVNSKPILHIDPSGKIDVLETPSGRKKAIDKMCAILKEKAYTPENNIIYISHGDCMQDAEKLKEKIESKLNFKEVRVIISGPMIGSHMGPDTLCVSYMGKG